jgi:hypothetical protein
VKAKQFCKGIIQGLFRSNLVLCHPVVLKKLLKDFHYANQSEATQPPWIWDKITGHTWKKTIQGIAYPSFIKFGQMLLQMKMKM